MVNERINGFRMRRLWQYHKLRSISPENKNKKRNNNISSVSESLYWEKTRQYMSKFWLSPNHYINGMHCHSYLHRQT